MPESSRMYTNPLPAALAKLKRDLRQRAQRKGLKPGTKEFFSYTCGTYNREARRIRAKYLLSSTLAQRRR
jgi:hypothetical protein